MKIIAFDLGATMGFATNHNNSCGHKIFKGVRVERFCQIKRWLTELYWEPYSVVIYETPLGRGQDATRSLWGIAGILEAIVTEKSLPVLNIAVPSVKKFVTGNGRASKEDMIKAAKKKGFPVKNEHEADAVGLLHYAMANLEKIK